MAKVSNKQIANALKEAVPFLMTTLAEQKAEPYGGKKDWFICFALRLAAMSPESKISQRSLTATRAIINRRLDGCNTIPRWLQLKAKIPPKLLTFNNVQAYRHAWLQSLIKEFEGE